MLEMLTFWFSNDIIAALMGAQYNRPV